MSSRMALAGKEQALQKVAGLVLLLIWIVRNASQFL